MPKISFIIPTIMRASLGRTIDSIDTYPGDEIIVVEDKKRDGFWGNAQRNEGMVKAKGDYLAFIDDDDWYAPEAREIMARAMEENPGLPNLFRMQYPDGVVKWKDKRIYPGNVSTQMILVPNIKEKLVSWERKRNMADYLFISNWKWKRGKTVWREEIIAYLGHNEVFK